MSPEIASLINLYEKLLDLKEDEISSLKGQKRMLEYTISKMANAMLPLPPCIKLDEFRMKDQLILSIRLYKKSLS